MKKFLSNFEEYVCCILFMGMLGLGFINIIGRYFLSASISFTEELLCACFVLLCMLGTAVVAKTQEHLGVTVLVEQMSERHRTICAVIANVLGVVFSLILIDTGLGMVIQQYNLNQLSIALQWPEWIFGSFLPFGAAMMALRFGQATFVCVKKLH